MILPLDFSLTLFPLCIFQPVADHRLIFAETVLKSLNNETEFLISENKKSINIVQINSFISKKRKMLQNLTNNIY